MRRGAQHIRAVFPALQCTAAMLSFESVRVVPGPPVYCARMRPRRLGLRSHQLCVSALGEHQWEIVERGLSPLAKCHWNQRSVIPGVRPSWEWRECVPPAQAMARADAVP